MDKKKLIGMILGVTLFAALIAGATFAWLSFNATVTGGTYSGASLNFTYTYTAGSTINGISILGATPARESIASGTGYTALTVTKPEGTAPTESFNIKLHKTSNTISPESVIRYAVCLGNATTCANTGATTIESTASGFVAYGQLGTWDSNSDLILYSDTTTFKDEIPNDGNDETDNSKTATYYVYLWIDGSLINDTNQESILGETFSGYIHAESTQTDQ